MQLADLIQQARDENKWLCWRCQDLWLSPDQLAQENASGRRCWGVVNWELRDPAERVAEAEQPAPATHPALDRVRAALV